MTHYLSLLVKTKQLTIISKDKPGGLSFMCVIIRDSDLAKAYERYTNSRNQTRTVPKASSSWTDLQAEYTYLSQHIMTIEENIGAYANNDLDLLYEAKTDLGQKLASLPKPSEGEVTEEGTPELPTQNDNVTGFTVYEDTHDDGLAEVDGFLPATLKKQKIDPLGNKENGGEIG